MDEPLPAPVTWWLLPNLLAIDAPVVAVVWQRFLANRSAIPLPWEASAALAAAVWCIYLADRWLDARRGAVEAERHRIAARRPGLFMTASALSGCAGVLIASRLPGIYVRDGCWVGAGIAMYLLAVHAIDGLAFLPGSKEFLVAVGFAAGVAIPLGIDDPALSYRLPAVVAFGVLCWLNCRLIDRWEDAPSRSSVRPWPEALLGGLILAAAVALPLDIGLALGVAALALLAVHVACRHRPRAARVLADVSMLTPLLFWSVA
jgi:hypothetical protein